MKIKKILLLLVVLLLNFSIVYALDSDITIEKSEIRREGIENIIAYDIYNGIEVIIYEKNDTKKMTAYKGEEKLFDVEIDGFVKDLILFKDKIMVINNPGVSEEESFDLVGYTLYDYKGELASRGSDMDENYSAVIDVARMSDDSYYFDVMKDILYQDLDLPEKVRTGYGLSKLSGEVVTDHTFDNIVASGLGLALSIFTSGNNLAILSNNAPTTMAEDELIHKIHLYNNDKKVFEKELDYKKDLYYSKIIILDKYLAVLADDKTDGVIIYLYSKENGELVTSYKTELKKKNDETKYFLKGENNKFTIALDNEWYSYEIKEEEPKKEEYTYKILEGENQTFKEGNLVFKADAPFSLLSTVLVNDKELTKDKDYEAKEGSTVITLKEEYLKRLKNGEYELTINYTDGNKVTTKFKVEANPNTNDKAILVFVLAIISLFTIIYIYNIKIKKYNI